MGINFILVENYEVPPVIRAIGEAYHPYDLERAEAQPPERLAARLDGIWQQLAGIAKAADLPARAWAQMAKAQRLTPALLATLAFFFATVRQRVEALSLSPDIEAAVLGQLIPALYIERVAARCTGARQGDLSSSTTSLTRSTALPVRPWASSSSPLLRARAAGNSTAGTPKESKSSSETPPRSPVGSGAFTSTAASRTASS